MIYDDDLTAEEIRLIKTLKAKNRMEQDEIIGDYENDIIRINR